MHLAACVQVGSAVLYNWCLDLDKGRLFGHFVSNDSGFVAALSTLTF